MTIFSKKYEKKNLLPFLRCFQVELYLFDLKLSAIILQQHLLASGLLSYLHEIGKQVFNLEQRKSKRIKETHKNFLLRARFC